jgi:hypothetical protein
MGCLQSTSHTWAVLPKASDDSFSLFLNITPAFLPVLQRHYTTFLSSSRSFLTFFGMQVPRQRGLANRTMAFA